MGWRARSASSPLPAPASGSPLQNFPGPAHNSPGSVELREIADLVGDDSTRTHPPSAVRLRCCAARERHLPAASRQREAKDRLMYAPKGADAARATEERPRLGRAPRGSLCSSYAPRTGGSACWSPVLRQVGWPNPLALLPVPPPGLGTMS